MALRTMTFRRIHGQPERTTSSRVRKPSSAGRRKAKRQALGEDVGFLFGMLVQVMPLSAMLIGIVGTLTGIVTPVEAVVSAAVTGLLVVLAIRGNRVVDGALGALVEGMARVVVAAAPVPVVGKVAEVLGKTMVLWIPAVLLALVALTIRGWAAAA
jgi:hypothetical protein